MLYSEINKKRFFKLVDDFNAVLNLTYYRKFNDFDSKEEVVYSYFQIFVYLGPQFTSQSQV